VSRAERTYRLNRHTYSMANDERHHPAPPTFPSDRHIRAAQGHPARRLTSGAQGHRTCQAALVQIRLRIPEDLDALVAVAARVREVDNYPSELPGADFARFFAQPEPMAAWVAVVDGRVIGHVALNQRPSRPAMRLVEAQRQELPPMFVARLLVDPGARRQGVGELLLTHAQREGRTAAARCSSRLSTRRARQQPSASTGEPDGRSLAASRSNWRVTPSRSWCSAHHHGERPLTAGPSPSEYIPLCC
jgi:GNAT superfamily N-acetyltransferase